MTSSKRALIFHGTMGSPDGNWFPWLKDALEQEGWHVIVPTFPTPENHSLTRWIAALQQQAKDIKSVDLIVGHSLGANLMLHILESGLCKTDKAIFVGCTIAKGNIAAYNELNKSFVKDFDWAAVKRNFNKAYILHGDDDPYVPIAQAKSVAGGLGLELQIIKEGGHLNIETGYDRFPLLLDLIHE